MVPSSLKRVGDLELSKKVIKFMKTKERSMTILENNLTAQTRRFINKCQCIDMTRELDVSIVCAVYCNGIIIMLLKRSSKFICDVICLSLQHSAQTQTLLLF